MGLKFRFYFLDKKKLFKDVRMETVLIMLLTLNFL